MKLPMSAKIKTFSSLDGGIYSVKNRGPFNVTREKAGPNLTLENIIISNIPKSQKIILQSLTLYSNKRGFSKSRVLSRDNHQLVFQEASLPATSEQFQAFQDITYLSLKNLWPSKFKASVNNPTKTKYFNDIWLFIQQMLLSMKEMTAKMFL